MTAELAALLGGAPWWLPRRARYRPWENGTWLLTAGSVSLFYWNIPSSRPTRGKLLLDSQPSTTTSTTIPLGADAYDLRLQEGIPYLLCVRCDGSLLLVLYRMRCMCWCVLYVDAALRLITGTGYLSLRSANVYYLRFQQKGSAVSVVCRVICIVM